MEKEGRHLFWLLFTNRWMSLLSHWDLLYFPVTLNLWCNPAVCFASLNFPFQHLPPCDDITLVLCVFSWVVCCHWLNFLHMLFFVYNVLLRFVISSFFFFWCPFIMMRNIKNTCWGGTGDLSAYFCFQTPVCGINDNKKKVHLSWASFIVHS